MQQWEYGYLYIVGFNLREWHARPPGSERRVAVAYLAASYFMRRPT
jgi:hypothetical protein